MSKKGKEFFEDLKSVLAISLIYQQEDKLASFFNDLDDKGVIIYSNGSETYSITIKREV